MGKIRRGNYVLITWKGDHSPRHVHVFKDNKLVLKWNLDAQAPIFGQPTARIVRIIIQLQKEGTL
jgi:hypothetical protein